MTRTTPADLAQFSMLLQRLAPGVGGLGTLELVDDGYSATVLRSPAGVAIRVPRTERAALRQQALSSPLRRLARLLPVAIPMPLWTLPMGDPFPLGVSGYTWLDGIPLSAEDPQRSVAEQVGTLLAAMHALDVDLIASFKRTLPDRATIDFERDQVMATALPYLRDTQPAATFVCLAHWWDRYRSARQRWAYTPRLVHGDLWYGNVLVDATQQQLTGVLDWENVCIDDPAQDFATLSHSGDMFCNWIVQAYERAGGVIDADLIERRQWHWEFREFTGLAMALDIDDEEGVHDAVRKLREGALRHCSD